MCVFVTQYCSVEQVTCSSLQLQADPGGMTPVVAFELVFMTRALNNDTLCIQLDDVIKCRLCDP